MYFLTISARWIEALSSITSQCIGLIFSSSLMNLITSIKKSIKSTELILPTRFAAITLPVVVIAVTKNQEFLNQTLLMICSFPLGIHDRLFFVSLEKEVSSMLINILKFSITFHSLIENHCLINV